MMNRSFAIKALALISASAPVLNANAGLVKRYVDPESACVPSFRDQIPVYSELQNADARALRPKNKKVNGQLVYAKDEKGNSVGNPLPELDKKGQPVMEMQVVTRVSVLPSRDPNKPGFYIDRTPEGAHQERLFVPFSDQNKDDGYHISVPMAKGEVLIINRYGKNGRIDVTTYTGNGDPLKSDTPEENLKHQIQPVRDASVDEEYEKQLDRELRIQAHNLRIDANNASKIAPQLKGCLDLLKKEHPSYCATHAVGSYRGELDAKFLDSDVPRSNGTPEEWFVRARFEKGKRIDPTERDFRVSLACQELSDKIDEADKMLAATAGLKCPDAGPAICAADPKGVKTFEKKGLKPGETPSTGETTDKVDPLAKSANLDK